MSDVITTIAAPIATAVVGSIAARLGLGYRTKQVAYLKKRLGLISAALRSDGSFCSARQREELTRDFRETVEGLLATSVNAEEERTLARKLRSPLLSRVRKAAWQNLDADRVVVR
jgi:hypothetical protein